MDAQTLINISFSLATLFAGWIIRSIYDAMNRLKDDVSAIQREIHTEYVRKDDYRLDIKEMKDMLTAIFKRLDSKADK